MNYAPLYTREELDRAIALKESGLSWATIGERMGRSEKALKVAVCRYRKGRTQFRRVAYLRQTEAMIAAVEAGRPVSAIAAEHKVSSNVACGRLAYRGYDAEVRAEYRRAALRATEHHHHG